MMPDISLYQSSSLVTSLSQLPGRLHGHIAVDTETKDPKLKEIGPGWAFEGGGDVAGVSLACDNFSGYIGLSHLGGGNIDNRSQFLGWLRENLGREDQIKVFANSTYDVGWLRRIGVPVSGPIEDVQIQAPLLDEYKFSYSLDNLAKEYLGEEEGKDYSEMLAAAEKAGVKVSAKGGVKDIMPHIYKLHAGGVARYATQDAVATYKLWQHLGKLIEEQELQEVYAVECGLVPLLVEMRWRGFRVNLDGAEQMARDFAKKEKEFNDEIKRQTGVEIDPWKADSVAKALTAVGIECPTTPKTGKPSVTAQWLDSIEHPVAKLIVNVRQYNRARGTFIENFILGHQHKGRIHGQFNALKSDEGGTVSGRFSASAPNLQQLPKRGAEIGSQIRSLFLPEEGELLAAIDYSAQEPRWMAEFAYRAGVPGGREIADTYVENPHADFHQVVADMCGISRKPAKIIGLGLAYGMGGAKLCLSLGLPTEWKMFRGKMTEVAGPEGQALIETFHKKAPFLKALIKMCEQTARQRGYIKTAGGRRCRFPMVNGERWYTHKAFNKLIQGTSACQTKAGMLAMWKEGIIPLATVHDENVFSVKNEAEAKRCQELMETALPTTVPFVAEPKLGTNWGECS